MSEQGSKSEVWENAWPFEHVDEDLAYVFSHQLLTDHRIAIAAGPTPDPIVQDVGDIVVMEANRRIVLEPRPLRVFDLSPPVNLVFTPAPGASGLDMAVAPGGLDPNTGTSLPLGDNATTEVPLGFSFPFLGQSYTSIFVNSDGNITFGVGDATSTDPRDAVRLIGGPPRVAPFLDDLNPSKGGSVRVDVRPDHVVVTWSGVPQFGTTNVNTFQVMLVATGEITFAYERIDARFGVVGIAEGSNAGPFNEIDLSVATGTERAPSSRNLQRPGRFERSARSRWPASSTRRTATSTTCLSSSPTS